jgi:uncharacterized protein (TIGR02246 family)
MDETAAWKIAGIKCADYETASNSGDPETYAQQFTDDALWIPPGRPIATSAVEILEAERPIYEKFVLQLTIKPFDVLPLSDTNLCVLFNVGGSITDKKNGAKREVDSTGMHIIRQETDGSWKIHRQVWNPRPAK